MKIETGLESEKSNNAIFLKYLDPNRTSGHVAAHILPRQALVLKLNILTSVTQK